LQLQIGQGLHGIKLNGLRPAVNRGLMQLAAFGIELRWKN
jgi:hypothetical protein